jgi:hypothetical protein
MGVHIPLWKKWLSYLFEFHLESAPSDLNPHLYVSLRKGQFQLSTANAIYSWGDLYDNFFKAFQRLPVSDWDKREVLILGFGLGSIPIMLEHKFNRNWHFTGVEADESVLWLAGKYTLPALKSPLELHAADAASFVLQTECAYDMICMDVFQDDRIPEEFQTETFLQSLKLLMNPEGVLLYNRLNNTMEDKSLTETFYAQVFRLQFARSEFWNFGGNAILVGFQDAVCA